MAETTRSWKQRPATEGPAGITRQGLDAAGRTAVLARAQAVLQSEADALAEAQRRLGDVFVDAVDAILRTVARRGRVCVTGVGKARLIGDKIQATLASTGTPSYPLHPVEALHGDLGMVQPEDIVVGLSKSGGSELVQLLPLVRKLGCTVILLTANPESAAAKSADFVLDLGDGAEACPMGLAPSSSAAAMLALGDALALCVMEQRGFGREDYARLHPGGALGRSFLLASDLMRTGPNCPTVSNTAVVSECFQAMAAAPKRAGATLVVDDDGRLVGILTQGDLVRLFEKPENVSRARVVDQMTHHPKAVNADESVERVVQVVCEYGIDELPVVDEGGRLLGMIDVQDLITSGFAVGG